MLWDIENAPSLGHFFDLWKEGNIVWTVNDWYLLSVAYKWLGGSKVYCLALPDFKGYKPGSEDDRLLVKEIWKLIDEADILIAHNGDAFDIKKVNARFAYYNLPPPSPYKTIDTYKVAKKYFNFTSNKLDALGDYLGYGRKLVHTGFNLWKACMAGDPKAWKQMIAYNKRDVVLLEKIYLHFRPWLTSHPNTALLKGISGCPNCGSTHFQSRGTGINKTGVYSRFQCIDCAAWSHGPSKKITNITN